MIDSRSDEGERIDLLEEKIAAIDDAMNAARNAAYPMSVGQNGKVTTMCVPIAEWDRLTKAKNPGGMTRQG